MILIGDGGATKTRWVVVDDTGTVVMNFKTHGVNPYFYTLETLTAELSKSVIPILNKQTIREIYLYAAGCATPAAIQMVTRAFKNVFICQPKVHIGSDMMGAAMALFHDEEGIAAILGTGANSCYFKNNMIIENVPSLGYLLSDWGSGAVLGRELVSAVMTQRLSYDLIEKFYDSYEIDRLHILRKVYYESFPNKYLASYTPFLKENIEHPEIQELLERNFTQFVEYYLLAYKHLSLENIKMLGSIAFHFQDELRKVGETKGIQIKQIIKEPISLLKEVVVQKSQLITN